jgi:type II secretory pathway component PulK
MKSRLASVLLMVLVVVALMVVSAYAFSSVMLQRREEAGAFGRLLQAEALAESGREWLVRMLQLDPESRGEMGGVYDNPAMMQAVQVIEGLTPRDQGRFSIVAPQYEDGPASAVRFGLVDESAKIHLNLLSEFEKRESGAGRNLLMGLPGMTADIADAILDWIDTDSIPRQLGAEAEYYTSLEPPSVPKNAPLETIEELLGVRGVTVELLFGGDRNRNGLLDPGESLGTQLAVTTADEAASLLGWAAYLTVHSRESNLLLDGGVKINLNDSDLEKLHTDLEKVGGKELATFVVAYRQFGPGPSQGPASPGQQVTLDLKRPAGHQLGSILDLIDARVQVPAENQSNPPVTLTSPVSVASGGEDSSLQVLMENATLTSAEVISGRININQAAPVVLSGIPGFSPEIADRLVQARDLEIRPDRPERRFPTWPLVEKLVTLEQMKEAIAFINTGGAVFSGQIVGHYDEGGPVARFEFAVDATNVESPVLRWRNISRLGRGYSPEWLMSP